jgi:hypothetical protein
MCLGIHAGSIALFAPCFWRKTLHTHLTLLNAVFMPRCLAAAEDPCNWQSGGWRPGNLAAGDGGQGLMALAQSTSMPTPSVHRLHWPQPWRTPCPARWLMHAPHQQAVSALCRRHFSSKQLILPTHARAKTPAKRQGLLAL